MPWNYDNLWKKAKKYFERSFNSDRRSEQFPLWSFLGLELLARATMAKIHPTLLADPQQGDNILHACGYPTGKKPPKSISIGAVFNRCTVIIPDFTEADFKYCMSILEKRNAELHSGELPLSSYRSSLWLPQFFKVCKILCESQGKTLIDLFGKKEAKTAKDMILVTLDKSQSEVRKLIKKHKDDFEKLDLKDRLEQLKKSEEKTRYVSGNKKKQKCPSCGANAIIDGEIVKYLEPVAAEDEIIESRVCLPTKFKCICCGLAFNNHSEMYVSGFGEQYTIEEFHDPKDYYQIEFDPSDYDDYDDYH